MKISIVEESDVSASSGRIVEIEDGQLVVDTCFICDNSPTFRSENSEMGYCCQEHQELHQPEDEEQPFPFIVKFRPDVGRWNKKNVFDVLLMHYWFVIVVVAIDEFKSCSRGGTIIGGYGDCGCCCCCVIIVLLLLLCYYCVVVVVL